MTAARRHWYALFTVLLVAGAACRPVQKNRHLPADSGPPEPIADSGRVDTVPEPPLELGAADLPGKGWHCYHFIGHYGENESLRFATGDYCTRTYADCLQKKPPAMTVSADEKAKACVPRKKSAFCFKERWRYNGDLAIHCFLKQEQCEYSQRMRNCTCSAATACMKFD